ncbi:hypothetical protein L198_05374 [Cryptococcus wingfieldii CBS 7118]|uniref:Uncharacterized protein n=1 Tax=Cryptococcus wingfieldii CBS 7118 TaxID=1295528 RepID=A0A1E3IY38_9TREE|nr:hypothetical protein L198_05374 [Cryptococcus wingfieldii CBS 7118]ODN93509.1 hypothetical protein L198_05374 [Cryptococcus wingfieldii CBS 7118]
MSDTKEDSQASASSGDHPNIPSFCYRLPPDLSSSIFKTFIAEASRDDIANLLCTSESTNIFFSYLLYEKLTVDGTKATEFFGDSVSEDGSVWPLCPRAGHLSAKELSQVMPNVPDSLCHRFVDFDPVVHLLNLGIDVFPEGKENQIVALFKKVLLCRSIKKIVVRDVAAAEVLAEFIVNVQSTFSDLSSFDTLSNTATGRFLAFMNVEWLVFDDSFAKDICSDETGCANDPVRAVLREIRPPNICMWAPKAFQFQEVSIIPQALLDYGLADQIERLIIHDATVCSLVRYYPARHTEFYFGPYLNPEDGSCRNCPGMAMPCQCCTNGYIDFFKLCFTSAVSDWTDESGTSHPRSFEMHGLRVDRAKVVSLLGKLWQHDSLWSDAGDDLLLVHGPNETVKCCEGCGGA